MRSHVLKQQRSSKKGFALIFAIFLSSLVLALGLAIFNLVIKEVLFAGIAEESQGAFYAADMGWECALYWDFEANAFERGGPDTEITCADTTYTVSPGNGYGKVAEFYVYSDIDDERAPCALVEVYQYSTSPQTEIRSNGFNTCEDVPRKVQRTIVLQY